jgi:hypothetical protein
LAKSGGADREAGITFYDLVKEVYFSIIKAPSEVVAIPTFNIGN